jgi:CheY-like chemotaxis protein
MATVLVVDDEESILETLTGILEDDGYAGYQIRCLRLS